jgi:hypothetical protein
MAMRNRAVYYINLKADSFVFRLEDSHVALRELDEMKQMGEEFFVESGQLMNFVGVLRGIDIHWNQAKR